MPAIQSFRGDLTSSGTAPVLSMKIISSILSLSCLLAPFVGFGESGADRRSTVLAMNPIGFWPADDRSKGMVMEDLSVLQNHGRIYHIQWTEDLLDFSGGFQWIEIPAHARYETKTFSIGGWIYTRAHSYTDDGMAEGMVFIGDGAGMAARNQGHFNLRLRKDCLIDVISDRKLDVLGTQASRITITPERWEHLLFSFDGKTASLYLNGNLVGSREGVSGGLARRAILVGADASWWRAHPPGSRSLDGSVRDLVLFDRALVEDEVKRLYSATQPPEEPASRAPEAGEVLERSEVSSLLKTLADEDEDTAVRARAALSLAAMGEGASSALPLLRDLLDQIVEREGASLPRIEDFLRNALIRALLDIDPADEEAGKLLGEAFARPVLETLDLNRSVLAPLQPLVEAGLYLDALDLYRTLDLDELERRFFRQGAVARDARPWQPNSRAFTGETEHEGTIYRVGGGEAWNGAERILREDFEAVVARLAGRHPEVRNWRRFDDPHLFRVPVTRIDPKGNEETIYLEGEDFVIGTDDTKYRGWSIAVDTKGYIHLIGGKHNRANPNSYIPGSWERMGASSDPNHEAYPHQMYWVSTEPGSLSFEFVGQGNNPRRMPPHYMNYMNFVQDRNGELFLYCRIDVAGIQSMGFYRYSPETQRWSRIEGDVHSLIINAEENNPDWRQLIHSQRRGALPRGPGQAMAFVWAWQPNFYNYCRSSFGVKFDPLNRMHVRMRISALLEEARVDDGDVYAWSDDRGETFHRADGSRVALPLTLNPVPAHHADASHSPTTERWDLFLSLIRDAGYTIIRWW
jgi:hypothetical protein